MNEARFTSLRFEVPGVVGPPGFVVSRTGALETVSDEASLRQSLLLLLSTVPGERVMRPSYGCRLDRYVFMPNDDTTAGLVIHEVRTAIERDEPRVEIARVDAGADPLDETRLIVNVRYRVRATAAVASLSLHVDLEP